jgi:hypothetical protein
MTHDPAQKNPLTDVVPPPRVRALVSPPLTPGGSPTGGSPTSSTESDFLASRALSPLASGAEGPIADLMMTKTSSPTVSPTSRTRGGRETMFNSTSRAALNSRVVGRTDGGLTAADVTSTQTVTQSGSDAKFGYRSSDTFHMTKTGDLESTKIIGEVDLLRESLKVTGTVKEMSKGTVKGGGGNLSVVTGPAKTPRGASRKAV